MPPSPTPFAALLLAAGASRRLGEPKQLLPTTSGPLVRQIAKTLVAAGAAPLVVVTGAAAEHVGPTLADLALTIVHNAEWEIGMGTSLAAGAIHLRTTRPEWPHPVLVCTCDQPGLSTHAISALLAALGRPSTTIASAFYNQHRGPPVLFTAGYLAELATLRGPDGARALLRRDHAHVAEVHLPELAFDIDTPADRDLWQRSQATH